MLRKALFTALFALATLIIAPGLSTAVAGGGDEIRVRAQLSGPTLASGKSEYRERMNNGRLEQRFKVDVEDAEPGAMMEIHLNGELVGIIVVGPLGQGELEYRTDPEPGESDPFPSGLAVFAGDGITVGNLSGTFEND
ncbi:MAG: hypothetical protein ACYTGP_01100 [Planctomycetota bacterium]|jgi:hypothetical protein